MGRFDGVLFVSDIDGTLIDTSQSLPAVNADAIRRFQAEGGLFTVATGRGPEVLDWLSLDFNAPIICLNGTAVVDPRSPRTALWQRTTPREALRKAVLYARAHAESVLDLCAGDLRENRRWKGDFRRLDPDFWRDMTVNKFNVTTTPEAAGRFVRDLSRLIPECRCELSWNNLLEFLPPEAGKGAALRALAKRIPGLRLIAAAGDYDNDLSLLAEADASFAPANAVPVVRAAAAYPLPDNDHGAVARALERLADLI
ncbi:MAG: HAD-IIB family hydrolase [Eubacteriales bacterium]|nr:HAD-IIB family hydrolase [Eubacteriales bacterium]